jgi:altered-inheritance-of-mitochondria protein 5
VTLTLGVAYLTVLAHERNRQYQAEALRSQSRVLSTFFEPQHLPPPQSRAELAREERSTIIEAAKDRWNEEVENAVRWAQRTDWSEVREGVEGAVARLFGSGLQKSREGIEEAEKVAAPKVQEAVDWSKAKAKEGADRAAGAVDKAAATTVSGTERAGAVARDQAGKIAGEAKNQLGHAGVKVVGAKDNAIAQTGGTVADVKASAHGIAESIKHSGGTVDAARGAVRDAVNKGIEKGKEAIGNAQAAIGLAAETIESKGQSAILSHSSAVEKALHERYEQPRSLTKTVEEALEERYKPIDKRDNTVLRGL